MLNANKRLLAIAVIILTLTACDKKSPAATETAMTSPTSTTAITLTKTEMTVESASTSTASSNSSGSNVAPVAVAATTSESTVSQTQTKEAVATIAKPEPITGVATTASTTAETQPTSQAVKFPVTGNKSLITQVVKAGTPEATVKNMMAAMMNGTPKQVASYYGVEDASLEQVFAEQQPTFKQQLKHLQLGEVEYNKDKTKAIIVGKMTLNDSTSNEVGYKLQKINGQWKLMP